MKLKKNVILFLMIVLAALMVVGCNKGKKTGEDQEKSKNLQHFLLFLVTKSMMTMWFRKQLQRKQVSK